MGKKIAQEGKLEHTVKKLDGTVWREELLRQRLEPAKADPSRRARRIRTSALRTATTHISASDLSPSSLSPRTSDLAGQRALVETRSGSLSGHVCPEFEPLSELT